MGTKKPSKKICPILLTGVNAAFPAPRIYGFNATRIRIPASPKPANFCVIDSFNEILLPV